MARLFSILRHAKSDWGNPGTSDHDRPLNNRGKKNAPQLGRLLSKNALLPDHILCSSAVRAQETAKLLLQGMDVSAQRLATDPQLYLASPAELLNAAAECDDRIEHLMLVAHNPGMTQLVNQISDVRLDNLPTCGVFCIRLNIDSWQQLDELTRGTLHWHHYPKLGSNT